MSIFFKAHGKPSFGLLLIRLTVGIYSLSLGIMQASNLEDYISKIKALHFFSENTAFIFGFIAPFILIIFGTLYIMGFFTPPTSLILAIVSIIKIASTGFLNSAGIPFNKDILFFVCFLVTLFSGAGVISFDALLDKRNKKPKVTAVVSAEVTKSTDRIIESPAQEKPATQE